MTFSSPSYRPAAVLGGGPGRPLRGAPAAGSRRLVAAAWRLRVPAGGAAAPLWPRSLPPAVPLEQPETSWRHFEADRGTGASCGRGGG